MSELLKNYVKPISNIKKYEDKIFNIRILNIISKFEGGLWPQVAPFLRATNDLWLRLRFAVLSKETV